MAGPYLLMSTATASLLVELESNAGWRHVGTAGCPSYDQAWQPRDYGDATFPPLPRVHGYRLALPESTSAQSAKKSGLPTPADPAEVPSSIIGVAVDGVLIQRSVRPLKRKKELLDACGGFRTKRGGYVYRGMPLCLLAALNDTTPKDWRAVEAAAIAGTSQAWLWPRKAKNPSPIVGYALDGYPIYGPYGADGKLATNLNACNAADSSEEIRYHMTPDFPYTIGCFMGRPGTTAVTYAPEETEGVQCPSPQSKPLPASDLHVDVLRGGIPSSRITWRSKATTPTLLLGFQG